MARKQYLRQRSGGGWEYRRRWPTRVRDVAPGEHFTRGLGTPDLTKAVEERPMAEIEFNAEVRRLERKADSQPRELTKAEAHLHAARWYREKRSELQDERPLPLNDYDREWRKSKRPEEGPYGIAGTIKEAEETAQAILKEAGVSAPAEGDGYAVLVHLAEAGLRELVEEGNRLATMRTYGGPSDPDLRDALRQAKDRPTEHTLGDLIEAHEAAKADGWGARTREDYRPAQRLIRDGFGSTRPLSSIGREDGRALLDLAKRLPANMGKREELKGLTVADAIKRGEELGLPTVAPKTINANYMAKIRAIFGWGVTEGWLQANPVAKLTVNDPTPDRKRRDAFTPEQLQTLFSSAPWSPRNDAPDGMPARYWVPLLALFHGLRRAEVCGLMLDDVTEREGHPFMLIRPNAVRTL